MLTKLTVRNFKSLDDVTVELPRLAVLFGPNAAGKSNLLDAIQALSWMGNARTLLDALGGPLPVRGLSFEAFSFPSDGLPALLRKQSARFTLEADLVTKNGKYRYRIEPEIDFKSGRLSVADEYLAQLGVAGNPKGTPAIERVDSTLHIRRKGKAGPPRREPLGLNHSILSDLSLGGKDYLWFEQVRMELYKWRTYYLEPRMVMRVEEPPADVSDIGVHGQYIAPFLYKLQAEYPKHFNAVSRTLRSIVPSIDKLTVELDEKRGTLNLLIRQSGIEYSSRVLSEGTLRILALCAIAVNPWENSLLALEEPESGVHPRRLELIAQLLLSLTKQPGRQVIVTTHSPLFADAILKAKRESSSPDDIGLFNVRRVERATVIEPFNISGPLFKDMEITAALADDMDDGGFESLLLRGLIDE
ncbi:MAG: AAA family ATPase [Candidatus Dadabacteria bacterium]|nr:AAA family ATPase [Candidatus Dadabacteria bacterium]